MLAAFVSAGFSGLDFWGLSLWEYHARMTGARARILRGREDDAWAVWHTAALTSQAAQGKLMPLRDLMRAFEPDPGPQAPDEMQAMFNMLAGAWGADPLAIKKG
ncbi:hypothetical protein [Falsihalocynthiibacter arcticus]|uniref:hypothetical protein n=1 Tax=Falsihalocynthiibacter arcticus TaxID=1579316 RepID=UPI0030020D2E